MSADLGPDLRLLRAFDAVARLRSLSSAGAALRITQPAVSYLITNLERELGLRLLERGAHGSTLTQPGSRFAIRIARFLEQVGAALDAVACPPVDSLGLLRAQRLSSSQLRALLHVLRSGDVAAAAQVASVRSQAVLRSLRGLELLVGARLLEHLGERILLNPAGQELGRRVVLAVQEITWGLDEIGADRPDGISNLRVGALVLSPRPILTQAVEACMQGFPDHTIEITEGSYEELVVLLRAGAIDLIFGALRDPPPFDDLSEVRLHQDPYVVACRRGHPLAGRKRLGRRDLERSQFILPTAGLRRRLTEALLREWKVRVTPQVHTSWLPSIVALLRTSDRLAILSKWHIGMDEANDLEILQGVQVRHRVRHVGVTTRADWLTTPLQQAFLESLHRVSRARLLPEGVLAQVEK